jgi:hypothetical protein
MNELAQIIRTLAIQSYRYNTFRGRWTDMPDSTWLCVLLGIASSASFSLVTYIEYGMAMALAVPGAWLAAAWLICDSWEPNKRLLSAVFLTVIPLTVLMTFAGSGHLFAEVAVGMYVSSNVMLLKTRGGE